MTYSHNYQPNQPKPLTQGGGLELTENSRRSAVPSATQDRRNPLFFSVKSHPSPSVKIHGVNDDARSSKKAQKRPRLILDPEWKSVIAWQSLLALFIIYNVIIIPYRIGFYHNAEGTMYAVEFSMDCFFAVDLVLGFRLGFIREGVKIFDWKQITYGYLTSWFIIDFASSFPTDLIVAAVTPPGQEGGNSALLRIPRLLRFLRLFRLLKLMKLLNLGKLFIAFEDATGIDMAYIKLLSLLFKILFLSHTLCCFWHFISIETSLPGEGWVEANGLMDADRDEAYLASLYWAITTLTTVGYGDILPMTIPEKTFALFSMLIGATVFGYIIGNLAELLESINRKKTEIHREMLGVKAFLISRKAFNTELKKKIRSHFEYNLSRAPSWDQEYILDKLPLELRGEVLEFLVSPFARMPVFDNSSKAFKLHVFPLFHTRLYSPRELVLKGCNLNSEMIYIKQGEVEVINHSTGSTRGSETTSSPPGGEEQMPDNKQESAKRLSGSFNEGGGFEVPEDGKGDKEMETFTEDSFLGNWSLFWDRSQDPTIASIIAGPTGCQLMTLRRSVLESAISGEGGLREMEADGDNSMKDAVAKYGNHLRVPNTTTALPVLKSQVEGLENELASVTADFNESSAQVESVCAAIQFYCGGGADSCASVSSSVLLVKQLLIEKEQEEARIEKRNSKTNRSSKSAGSLKSGTGVQEKREQNGV